MIDLHCHILPAVDDGAVDLDESLAMARLAVADGIQTVFATPHVTADFRPRSELVEEVRRLQRALAEADIPLEIQAGAEYASALGLTHCSDYQLGDSPYLLLEFPHSHLPADAGEMIFQLLSQGLTPIIAHPERNPSIIRSPELLEALVEQGALTQLTAGSLLGDCGGGAQRCARHLLRRGLCHFMASDGHGLQRRPLLSAAVKVARKLTSPEVARALVDEHPARVLAGQEWPA